MQNSKRIQRIVKSLDKLEDILKYYTNGCDTYMNEFRELRKTIEELALEKKEDHARFAKKLKDLWSRKERAS